jgi:hypothetical protein
LGFAQNFSFINFSILNKKQIIMDEIPEISTYMKRDVQDDWPAEIELHTYVEIWNGIKMFTTATYDSKERMKSVTFFGSPENKLFDEHKGMVDKYREIGYQVINETYSPKIQDKLDRIKLENGILEKLLKDVNIPDKL